MSFALKMLLKVSKQSLEMYKIKISFALKLLLKVSKQSLEMCFV